MEIKPDDIIRGRRFAVSGFDFAEARAIISVLQQDSANARLVNALTSSPMLNPLASYDMCVLNVSGDAGADAEAVLASFASSRRSAMLVGDPRDLNRFEASVLNLRNGFVLRPYHHDELRYRICRVILAGDQRSALPRSEAVQKRVLIADDDATVVMMISAILSHVGFKCTVASDGKEVLDLAAKEPFDIILLDLAMPEMDGLTVLARLKQSVTTAGVPVILVTVDKKEEDIVQGFTLGADSARAS